MTPTDPRPVVSRPRFPHVPKAAGHYESFFLKACHPAGGLAVWIRYTIHKRPGAAAKGFTWFTLFDAADGVLASKAEFAEPVAGNDSYVTMDQCRFAPGEVLGTAASQVLDATWDLRFEGDEPPMWHLPASWMYRSWLPRTKALTPHPHVVFNGWVEAGARRIDLSGWPGTVGHNWGAEHAQRAIWIHGANFAGAEDAWLDLAIARVGIGPVTTPWIANGVLHLDGRRHRLGGLKHLRSTRVDEEVETCSLELAGDEVAVTGVVGAPRPLFVGWIYAQPGGGSRHTINCSIADLRLEVSRRAGPPVALEVIRGAAYELQMAELYPPIPPQPFPDG